MKNFAGAVILGVLWSFSKETGIMWPALALGAMIGTGAFERGHNVRPGLRWGAALLGAGALAGIGFLLVRTAVLGTVAQQPAHLAPPAAMVWTQLRATAAGIGLLAWPGPLLADYQAYPVTHSATVAGVLSVLLVLGLLIGAVIGVRRAPRFSMSVVWWFAAILPVSNLVPTMQFQAERFLYLAMVGAIAALVPAVVRWATEPGNPQRLRPALAVGGAVVAALAIRASLRVPDWADGISRYSATLKTSPANMRARSNYANGLMGLGRFTEALEHVRMLPPHHAMRKDLEPDLTLLVENKADLTKLAAEVEANPEDVALRIRFAELAVWARQPETAIRQFSEAKVRAPKNPAATAGLALMAVKLGGNADPLKAEAEAQAEELLRTGAMDAETSATLHRLRSNYADGPWRNVELMAPIVAARLKAGR